MKKMRKRKLSKKVNRKVFKKGAKVKKLNFSNVSRGGIRL